MKYTYNRDICRLLLLISVIYSRSYAYGTSFCSPCSWELYLNMRNNGGRYNAYYGSCLSTHRLKATSFELSELSLPFRHCAASVGFLLDSLFKPENGGELRGVTARKTVLFIMKKLN
jgi:hypothetical protein